MGFPLVTSLVTLTHFLKVKHKMPYNLKTVKDNHITSVNQAYVPSDPTPKPLDASDIWLLVTIARKSDMSFPLVIYLVTFTYFLKVKHINAL